jgi:hypothetical protein
MFKWPAYQNFTADRMSLVTPPNSNGWNIPLRDLPSKRVIFSPFLQINVLSPKMTKHLILKKCLAKAKFSQNTKEIKFKQLPIFLFLREINSLLWF